MAKQILNFPSREGQRIVITALGTTHDIASYGSDIEILPVQSVVATAGRMNVIPLAIATTEQGHISPRDDGGTSLDLNEIDPAITSFSVTTDAGETVQVDVQPKRQANGWPSGRVWMLPINKETGKLAIRKGRKGRKFFVTKRPRSDAGGKGGYTKQDIATETGLALSTITDNWIINSTVYGRSADKPLEMNTGFSVWGNATHNQGATANMFASNWLVLEKGYDYRDGVWSSNRHYISRGASGESPLHPILITSYGDGARPKLAHELANYQTEAAHTWIAFQDIDIESVDFVSAFDTIFSNMDVLKKGIYLQGGGHRTIFRVGIINSSLDVPAEGLDYWEAMKNRKSGIYVSSLKSLFVNEIFVDQSGWRDGYHPTSLLYADSPNQPPSMYSHNLYLQYSGKDTVVRRIISTRAASLGVQCRTSGILEDLWSLDDNMTGNQLGIASSNVANSGHFAMVNDIVATSAGFRQAPDQTGAKDWGIDLGGYDGTVNRAIFMHRSDPNNQAEIDAKGTPSGDVAVKVGADRGFVVDKYVHRWDKTADNAAARGADITALNNTTAQLFIAGRGGANTTIAQYCNWLRTLSIADRMAELDAALQYFRTPWGLHVPKRINPTVCVFTPSTKCSGILWADRLNWPTYDTAGTVTGDSAELRGAYVRFGEVTVDMATVDGQGGTIELSSGLMDVDTLKNFAEVRGILSAQLFAGTIANIGTFRWESGLLVFPALVSGHNLIVDGQYPEVVLGSDHTIAAGKVLDIRCGVQGAVGWTGAGTATLTIANGGTLRLRHYAGAHGARMSVLERFKYDGDHADPTVTASVVLASGATVEVETTGLASGTYDLTGPGVTVTDNGAILPAGVSVTSRGDGTNKLVLTVPN